MTINGGLILSAVTLISLISFGYGITEKECFLDVDKANVSAQCINQTITVSYDKVGQVSVLYKGLKLDEEDVLFEMRLPDNPERRLGIEYTKPSPTEQLFYAYAKTYDMKSGALLTLQKEPLPYFTVESTGKPFNFLLVFYNGRIGYGNGSFIPGCDNVQPSYTNPCLRGPKMSCFKNQSQPDIHFLSNDFFPVISIDHHKKYDLVSAEFTQFSPQTNQISFVNASAYLDGKALNEKEREPDDGFTQSKSWCFFAFTFCFIFGLFLASTCCSCIFYCHYNKKLKDLKQRQAAVTEGGAPTKTAKSKTSKDKDTKKSKNPKDSKKSNAKNSTKKPSKTDKESKKKDTKKDTKKESKKKDTKKESKKKDTKKTEKQKTTKSKPDKKSKTKK